MLLNVSFHHALSIFFLTRPNQSRLWLATLKNLKNYGAWINWLDNSTLSLDQALYQVPNAEQNI